MGVASSLIVFAVGAVLRFAVTATSPDFNIHTVGVILMIVGGVGFVLSLLFWASWGGFGFRRRTIVEGPATGAPYGAAPYGAGPYPGAYPPAPPAAPAPGGGGVYEERQIG